MKKPVRDELFYYISHFNIDNSVSTENIIKELNKFNNINDIFYKDDDITPLMLATKNGQAEIVELLLKRGADPNIGNTSGARALLFATMKNDPETLKIIDLLLEYGANPALKSRGGQSIIEAAALCRKFDLADKYREIAKKFEDMP